ncbi:MAG: HD domain-containing protein [Candidatus Nomurabacteria bacterium]|nr:HD domain-containing protein [Candidatus Nomurabacteria bacterium]
MDNQNKINRVQEFARNAHKHLSRTSITGVKKPHIHHIQEVADLVWISGGTDDEIVSAWLHDTVEDTDTTLEEIEKNFGKEVSLIVDGLTDHEHFKDLELQERKKLQAERISNESLSVRRVKIADQISNIRGLTIDPVEDMTPKECYNYIIGAKLIADKCKGISPILDSIFDQFYQKGVERYKNN